MFVSKCFGKEFEKLKNLYMDFQPIYGDLIKFHPKLSMAMPIECLLKLKILQS